MIMYFLPTTSFLGDLLFQLSIVEPGLPLVAGIFPGATILALSIWLCEGAKAFFHKNWGVVTTQLEADSALVVSKVNFLCSKILYLLHSFWVISASDHQSLKQV